MFACLVMSFTGISRVVNIRPVASNVRLVRPLRNCHVNRNCLPFMHPFLFYVGSMFLMRRFQLIRHCVGYFSHLRYPSKSSIPYSVQLGNSTHPSEHHRISATYCDFFTAHAYWFLPGFSLLHTYPALSLLRNYLRVPSPYCASILLDEALYSTPFLDPSSINTICPIYYTVMFLHTLPHREYCIRHPSTWHEIKICVHKPSLNNPFRNLQDISALSLYNPHNPGCFTPLYKMITSHNLSTPLIGMSSAHIHLASY